MKLTAPIKIIRDMLYPRLCPFCNRWLAMGETDLCLNCSAGLPRTYWKPDMENPAARTFWGRVPLDFGCSWLHFHRGGITQKLLHQIKYRGNKKLADSLGKTFAVELVSAGFKITADLLVPVPLHPSKQRIRGYNQSALLAAAMAKEWSIPSMSDVMERKAMNATQTQKNRGDRWENVNGIFVVPKSNLIAGRKVILIDDVITTGATSEACITALLRAGAKQVGVLSLAYADV